MEAKRLKVGRLSSILAISLILLLGSGLICSSAVAQTVGSLDKVEVKKEGDAYLVVLSGRLPKDYIAFKDIGPLRIVVDLPATRPNVIPMTSVDNGLINTITATTLDTSAAIPSTRVEVGLDVEAGFTANQTPEGIVIAVELPGAAPRKAEVREEITIEPEPRAEAPAPVVMPEVSSMATAITDIEALSGDKMSKVIVTGNGSLNNFNAFVLTNPARLVVDIKGVGSALTRNVQTVGGPIIRRVRVGSTYKDKVRLVVDFSGDKVQPYNLTARDTTLTIEVGSNGGEVPSRIKALDFRVDDDGKAILTIKTDHKLSYDIKRSNSKDLLMTLYKTTVPDRLRRPFNTTQFPSSAVDSFVAKPSRKKPGSVEMSLAMREMVPYHVAWVGDDLLVKFDATGKPVEPAMELPRAASAGEMMAQASPREAAAAAVISPAAAAAYGEGGPRISLDLQGAKLSNVLRLLADLTDKNLVVEPGVKGTVTMKVNNVPWRQVLELVLKINDLGMMEEGNVIRIAQAKKLHRESMDALKREQEAREAEQKAAKVVVDTGNLTTSYLQVNYSTADDMKSKISEIKSKDGTISVDSRTNTLIYKDYPKRIEDAKALLERLDKPTAQVLIEARIVTASKNFTRRLGIQWGGRATRNSDHLGGTSDVFGTLAQGMAVNLPPSAAFGGIGWNFSRLAGDTISSLQVELEAMETEGYGRIISSPRIITMDNETAKIQQGTQIPYPKQTEDGISTEFIAATLELNVTPHVTPDNRVQIEISAKKNAPDFQNTVGGAPSINTQEANTKLLVNDGDTVVIGGIVNKDDATSFDKVPYFADVPLFGWFFKNKSRVMTTSELLIFVSPRIVQLQ